MSTIRKRGNSYQIRVSCGTDVSGKKIVESMTWKPDETMTPRQIEKELNKVAVQFEEKVKKGVTTKTDKRIKVHTLCDIYLEMQKKTLSPTSYHNYENIINVYIIPLLGHLKLSEVTPLHLQKFVNILSEQKTKNGTSLSPVTIKKYFTILQSLFHFAYKMGFLEYNPFLSKNITLPKIPPANIAILEEKEIKNLLECLEEEPIMWKVLIHLALCTGCRRGELAALQWKDIDWEKKQVKISKSMYYINGIRGIKLPKSNSSYRTITIPDYMIQMLKYYKNRQMEQKLISIQNWNSNDMLFITQKGEFIATGYISAWFKKFLKRHNLPHIKFHALRHTAATILLISGTNIKTVSNRLGHSSLSTTNRYVHALADADKAAADTLEQKLNFNKIGQKGDKKA